MRFLGIGDYCDLGALYLRLIEEGHEVKVFISNPSCRGTLAGLVAQTWDWRPAISCCQHLRWERWREVPRMHNLMACGVEVPLGNEDDWLLISPPQNEMRERSRVTAAPSTCKCQSRFGGAMAARLGDCSPVGARLGRVQWPMSPRP